jgi:hypothetical protein
MRDDFSKRTIDALAGRAGHRCSNPGCRQPTRGPRSEPDQTVNIGVAAHITAASQGGPRYDPGLTSEQRQHAENGLWLCQNCAKLVDNDPTAYPVAVLRAWKREAEEAARREIEEPAEPAGHAKQQSTAIQTGSGGLAQGGSIAAGEGGNAVGRDVHGDLRVGGPGRQGTGEEIT